MQEWLLKYKKILITAVILGVILAGSWQFIVSKVGQTLQNSLLQRVGQQINGRLQVADIDLSLLGWVQLRDVSLYDSKGGLMARSPMVKIHYQWSNLAKGNLDMSRIETAQLQGTELWLKQEDGRWNWEGLLKDQTSATNFRGKVQMEEGLIHVEAALLPPTIDGVNGVLDFQTYPDLEMSFAGKVEQSPLSISGHWGENRPYELTIKADEVDLAKFRTVIPATPQFSLTGGKLSKLTVVAKRDAAGAFHGQGQGEFSGVNVDGKVSIREGQGRFSADEAGLQLKELSLLVADQRAEGQGNIFWQEGQGTLDVALKLPDVDAAAFVAGLAVERPVSLQVKIAGPLSGPDISGNFNVKSAAFSGMTVNAITGKLRYAGNQLLLEQVNGSAHSGTLSLGGEVLLDSGRYELDVAGNGMESSRLTDKDVQGPLDFTGHVSGQGEEAVTRGNFTIYNGKTYGISFQTLDGLFVKRGGVTETSDIAVHTSLGTFYPEQLSQEALARINQQGIPTTQDGLKRAVAGKLIERLFR